MKKILYFLVFVAAVLAVIITVMSLFINRVVKAGVETVAPEITKTAVGLASVDISALSGRGQMRDLVIGNPPGYKTGHALKLGSVTLEIDPRSVFSDRVVVKELVVDLPEIVYEATLKESNIGRILRNIKAAAGPATSGRYDKPREQEAGKKIQINDLRINGGRILLSSPLLQGKSVTVSLPDIHLQNIGDTAGGASAPEVMETVFAALSKTLATAVAKSGQGLLPDLEALKGAGMKKVEDAVRQEAADLTQKAKEALPVEEAKEASDLLKGVQDALPGVGK